jgi:hypothetical protein
MYVSIRFTLILYSSKNYYFIFFIFIFSTYITVIIEPIYIYMSLRFTLISSSHMYVCFPLSISNTKAVYNILVLRFSKLMYFLSVRHAKGSGHTAGLLGQFVTKQWPPVSPTVCHHAMGPYGPL